jgi:hypothetical protein
MILEADYILNLSIYVYIIDIHFDSVCNYFAIKIFRIGCDVKVSLKPEVARSTNSI